ncbi:MAG: nicotinate-nucleotide adenylyltransferase [Planctomycetota bacterium]
MHETGVIHGRFQVLHNDHMKYITAGKEKCRHLVIGITNPDPMLTKIDEADKERSDPSANPFSYYERQVMLKAALLDTGISVEEFTIVPFPISFPELYRFYVPEDAVFFLTIYDEWGEKKLETFKSIGYEIDVLWRRPLEEKGLTSTHIRELISREEPWEHLVPQAVARKLSELGLLERVRKVMLGR